jgi:hypothetical protein
MASGGIVWRNGDLNDLTTRAAFYIKEIEREAAQVVDETAKEGAEVMRGYIEVRGTGWRGHQGRIEQGTMIDAVQSVTEKTNEGVRGRFGWGVRGGLMENYFRYQEQGFTIASSGHVVPPMHALLDSFIKVREDFIRKIVKIIK